MRVVSPLVSLFTSCFLRSRVVEHSLSLQLTVSVVSILKAHSVINNVFHIFNSRRMLRQMCGGPSNVKNADNEVQSIVDGLKDKISEMCEDSKPITEYTAVSYRSQVVAGTNFFVKVKLGDDKFAVLKIFRPLPHTNEPCTLAAVQQGKGETDEPEYF